MKTIKSPIKVRGIGLHSGKKVEVFFSPSTRGGIVFVRNDVQIPAVAESVTNTQLSTVIEKDGVVVRTIEHLMAAIAFLGIDNLRIDISGEETPILDGSARPWISLLSENGFSEIGEKKFMVVTRPVWVFDGDSKVGLLPYDGIRYEVDIDFETPVIGKQHASCDLWDFKEYSAARTFGFLRDLEYLQARGLALGASIENAIVIEEFGTVNPLRFENEFAKHKLVDSVGDMKLLGTQFVGRYIGVRPGHKLNNMLCRKVLEEKSFIICETSEEKSALNSGKIQLGGI